MYLITESSRNRTMIKKQLDICRDHIVS